VPESSSDGRVQHSPAESAVFTIQRRYDTELTTEQSTWFVASVIESRISLCNVSRKKRHLLCLWKFTFFWWKQNSGEPSNCPSKEYTVSIRLLSPFAYYNPNSITPTFTETSSRGKSWTQTISTCRDVCDEVRNKSATNPFVSL